VKPFFERAGASFAPGPHTRGPWSRDSMHGRLLAGLFAHVFEREHHEEPFHFARLTVDMFRLPRIAPVELTTEVIRSGRRIRVLSGAMTSEGREIARSTAVLLRRGDVPPGTAWMPDPWDAPHPDTLSVQEYENRDWTPMWETRPIDGPTFGGSGRKRAWLREIHPLVAGEPLTPFVRVAGSADFASPIAISGNQGLHYVNADITLYLARLPVDEWVGFEVANHLSSEGIAIGDTTLYDPDGPIGKSSVCAVANPREAGA
jgi:hypothetical protein